VAMVAFVTVLAGAFASTAAATVRCEQDEIGMNGGYGVFTDNETEGTWDHIYASDRPVPKELDAFLTKPRAAVRALAATLRDYWGLRSIRTGRASALCSSTTSCIARSNWSTAGRVRCSRSSTPR